MRLVGSGGGRAGVVSFSSSTGDVGRGGGALSVVSLELGLGALSVVSLGLGLGLGVAFGVEERGGTEGVVGDVSSSLFGVGGGGREGVGGSLF